MRISFRKVTTLQTFPGKSSRSRSLKQPWIFLSSLKRIHVPAVYLLGADDTRVSTLRQFRDTVLAKSATGEKLIQLYYTNGNSMMALFDYSPAIKYSAKKVLELFVPITEFLMAF